MSRHGLGGPSPPRWSPEEALQFLRSMDLFGMRFGLDRMRRLETVLGTPHSSFHSIHVVGTNGKSSTTRFVAAILQRHGLRTGAYLSPHLISYTERIQVSERDVDEEAFATALARAAWAAQRVNRTLSDGDAVTQFELLTAAAYWLLAGHGVDVAVVEAGLGGRYDATSVIDSSATVLTSVGLEHTRWLGPTVRDIAAEKLAVLRRGTALVLGEGLQDEVQRQARELAAELGADVVAAGRDSRELPPLRRAGGAFQRANFRLARCAAEVYLARALGRGLEEAAVADAAAQTDVPGRFERIDDDPPTLLDGAHNPASVDALVQSLGELSGDRPLAVVLGVLDDKDAARMLTALRPHCARLIVTAPDSPRRLPAPTLQSLAHQVGYEHVELVSDAAQAVAAARRWAAGCGGAVLATGSIHMIGEILQARGIAREEPSRREEQA